MDAVQPYLDSALSFLNSGYDRVNGPQGLLIALLAVVIMRSWSEWLPLTLGATFAFAVVDVVMEIAMRNGELKLPPVTDPAYLIRLATVFAGLLIIIAMFFAVKKVFFMRSAASAKAKAH
jgi:hypothetical protein